MPTPPPPPSVEECEPEPTPAPATENEPLAYNHCMGHVYHRAFPPLGDDAQLLWPVEGEIAMRFSMDTLILDPTLVQYRTNDNLRISANEGDYVRAGAYGQVLSVGHNVVRGHYVKIDHGNDWTAIYGQLANNIFVGVGDIVRAGQPLGTVGQPSMFGYMHGPHVHLHVTRGDVPVNPYELLVARN